MGGGVRERMGGSEWDNRRKEETGTESSREGEERQMGRDRQRPRVGGREKGRKGERNGGWVQGLNREKDALEREKMERDRERENGQESK